MYTIFRTTNFKKDYKKLTLENKKLLKDIIIELSNNNKLDEKYRDHKLTGNFLGCHIKPDLLLVYKINNDILELALIRVGSHSELFSFINVIIYTYLPHKKLLHKKCNTRRDKRKKFSYYSYSSWWWDSFDLVYWAYLFTYKQ